MPPLFFNPLLIDFLIKLKEFKSAMTVIVTKYLRRTEVKIKDAPHLWRQLTSLVEKEYRHFKMDRVNGAYCRTPGDLYAYIDGLNNSVIVNRNSEAILLEWLKYNTRDIEIIENPSPTNPTVEFSLKDTYKPRSKQPEAIAFGSKVGEPYQRLLGAQPGAGKTLMGVFSFATFSKRVAVVIKASYVDKWIEDFYKYLNITKDDILVIQGSKPLVALMNIISTGATIPKILIFTNSTLRNYIRDWIKLTNGEDDFPYLSNGYIYPPTSLLSTLGIGYVLIDEIHQEHYFNYTFVTLTDAEVVLGLSGTYLGNDPFIVKSQAWLFPLADRFAGAELNKYNNVLAVSYDFVNPEKIRTGVYGDTRYNHTEFEKSIMRNPKIKHDYFVMISDIAKITYFKNYVKGDSMFIFVSSIAMATELTVFMQKAHPALNVVRYCEDDPYNEMIMAEICVSTLLSAGTAVDKPNLTATIMTTNITSPKANIQVLHRTRAIPGREVNFTYTHCRNFDKHRKAHLEKRDLFSPYVKTHIMDHYPYRLG